MISFITDKNRNSEMKDIYKELLMKFFAVVSAIFIVCPVFAGDPVVRIRHLYGWESRRGYIWNSYRIKIK